jgi:hypothetical protein
MNFTHEITSEDTTGKIEYARSGSHEEGDHLKEIWRFTTSSGKVSILVAQEGYQTHYFSSDPKTQERGRFYNGFPMTATVKDR